MHQSYNLFEYLFMLSLIDLDFILNKTSNPILNLVYLML